MRHQLSDMRKVKFQVWTVVDLHGQWHKGEGLFHQWAGGVINDEGHKIQHTFAIVETEDGKIHEVEPKDIQFLDKLE